MCFSDNFKLYYDIGVVDIVAPTSAFTGPVNVTASIYNYGQSPVSNFNVYYQVDSGSQVVETTCGTIAPQQTVNYTFSNAADLAVEGQTYTIEAGTLLSNDEIVIIPTLWRLLIWLLLM